MKTAFSVISLSFLIVLLLVTPVIGSSEWVEYGRSTEGNTFSYDKDGVKHRTKRGVSIDGYNKLSYTLTLEHIDCKNQ